MMNIFNLLHHKNNNTEKQATSATYDNTVTLIGRIVHSYITEKMTIITLGIYIPKPNYPKVLFFGDNHQKAAQFKEGDMVRIEANIQSSRITPGKNQKKVSVFGDSIEAIPDVLDMGIHDVCNNINRIEVTGVVLDFVDWKNILKVHIRTIKNNRLSIVPIDYYYTGSNPLKDIKAGDVVSLKGTIQTKRKYFDDEPVYFENYVATDIIIRDIPYTELSQH